MSTPKFSQCPMCGGVGWVPRIQWRTLVLLPKYRSTPKAICRDCEGYGQISGDLTRVLIFFTDGSTWRTAIPTRVAKKEISLNREGFLLRCTRGEMDDEGLIHYHEAWPD